MSYKQHNFYEATNSICRLKIISCTSNPHRECGSFVVAFTFQAYQLLVTRFSNCPTIDEFCQGLLILTDHSPASQIQGTWDNPSCVIPSLHLVPGNTGCVPF
jgi:hypothetical protein